ncbi:MAG: hypothetical protein V3W18_03570 [candidate division Zixibacteria bacterium]
MNSEVLLELENKIERAVSLVVDLRKEKEKLESENQSLKRQLEDFKKEIEEYKKQLRNEFSGSLKSDAGFDSREIRKRLKKLTGKLAALEDSWN